MNSAQQPTQEVFDYAHQQVAAGVPPFDVQRQLVAHGWDTQTAALVMNHVRRSLEAAGAGQHPEQKNTASATATAPSLAGPLPPPFLAEGSATAGTAPPDEKKGKIPVRAYRDLIVGGIIMMVALALHVAGVHPVYRVLTLVFGLIQVVRGIVVAGLSQYRL